MAASVEGELEIARRLLDRELAIARRIQLSLMPGGPPELPGVEVATAYRAAREVGGDFYDAYAFPAGPSDAPGRDGVLGLAIADVTGKGVTAALMMAFSRAVLRSAAYNGRGPADALRRANRVLARDVRSGLFLTAIVAEVDIARGVVRYSGAGHEPPVLVSANGVRELPVRGEMLGLFDGLEPAEYETELAAGDVLVLFTDGVTDALDGSGRRFGDARFRAVLGAHRDGTARGLVDAVLSAVDEFAGGTPPADDITLIAARLTGPGDVRPDTSPAAALEAGSDSSPVVAPEAGSTATADAGDRPTRVPGPAPAPAPLVPGARFGHVNVVARDWRALAAFYVECFGCTLVPPERDYTGPDLDRGTGLQAAHLRGAHLRLPGHGDGGPTLEIYTYDPLAASTGATVNRPGWGHIAFQVPDVSAAREVVIGRGGAPVGDVVTLSTSDGRRVTWCYVTDPEGNIVELQSWS